MPKSDDRESRRTLIKGGAGMAATLALGADRLRLQGRPRRPNFVFVSTDGHRPQALSLNGNPIVRTPNFDRIGREGIQFHNSFVVNSLCLPSRATALTGLHSHNTGCVDNQGRAIPQDVPLFTDLLRQAGYEVGFFGKAHIARLGQRDWDHYFGFSTAVTDSFWPEIEAGSHGKVEAPQVYQGFVDDVVTDRAVRWLKQKRDKPFCLILWPQAPHAPFWRLRRYLDLYNGIPIPKPGTFDDDLKGYPGKPRAFAEANNKIGGPYAFHTPVTGGPLGDATRTLEEVAKNYYASIVSADDNVGKVFDALSETGQLDDTAILFTSDHGFFLGEWRMYDKCLMHEPSIRTPMLIRYPRLVKAGSAATPMILNLDIAPTFLELAGVPIPAWVQGRSMVPFLRGEEPKNWRQEWLYEYYEYPGEMMVRKNRGIRTERYKFIHYYEAPEEFELYDLAKDPGELHNLYGEPRYASLAGELRQRMEKLRRETDDRFVYEGPDRAISVPPRVAAVPPRK